jgi:hypothetical protein
LPRAPYQYVYLFILGASVKTGEKIIIINIYVYFHFNYLLLSNLALKLSNNF